MNNASTDTTKRKRIPRFVTENFPGGTARAFKAAKRRDLKALHKAWLEFRRGCAWVPGYPGPIAALEKALDDLKVITSAKNWGR